MKRTVSLILALTLILGCLFSMMACKNNNAGDDNNDNDNGGIVGDNNGNNNSKNNDNGNTDLTKKYVEMDFGQYGKIVLEIDPSVAPITADNFLSLVEDGFYDGLNIFRAQDNFVIQGGKNDSANITPIKGEFASNGHNNP